MQVPEVHLSQSSAKGASPCGTPIRELCKRCKFLRYIYHRALQRQVLVVHLSQSSAKGASPCGTSIRALQRVQVLDVHLSELRKGGKSLRYTYQSYPKGTCPQTAPTGDLCYQTALQQIHHKSLTMVHFLKPLQKSLRTQNPCDTPPWTCTPWSQDAAQDGPTMHSGWKATPPQEPQSDSHLMGREEGIQKTNTVQNTGGRAGRSWPQLGNH